MNVIKVIINFDLKHVESLKGRRKIINSIKDRLKKRNYSILDISGEYAKEASLFIVFASFDGVNKKLNKLEDFIYSHFPDIEFDMEYEIL